MRAIITAHQQGLHIGDTVELWPKTIDVKGEFVRVGETGSAYIRSGYLLLPAEPAPVPTVSGWKCERCGKALPKTAYVWQARYQKWCNKTNDTYDWTRLTSGYYCDPCADSREQGVEY